MEWVTYFRSSTLDFNVDRFPADILMVSILRFGHFLGMNKSCSFGQKLQELCIIKSLNRSNSLQHSPAVTPLIR